MVLLLLLLLLLVKIIMIIIIGIIIAVVVVVMMLNISCSIININLRRGIPIVAAKESSKEYIVVVVSPCGTDRGVGELVLSL